MTWILKKNQPARAVLLVIGIAFLMASYSAPALAQSAIPEQGPSTIEGTVKSPAGMPIRGASVVLRQGDARRPIEVTTTSEGIFVVSQLDAGVYTITASRQGWRDAAAQSIALRAGENKRIELTLQALKRTTDHRNTSDAVASMQFSDDPNFTVAGVTDYSGAGGHGSENSLRTSEALTRETLILKSPGPAASTPPNALELGDERARLQKMIAAGDRAELHSLLADVDERLNDPVAAAHEYEQAARLDPTENNYFAWGTELLLHRAAEPAGEVFKKGALAYPKSARLLAGLGAALYAAGLQEEAARRFCDASDLDPKRAELYLFLGEIAKTSTSSMPTCVEEKLSRFLHDEPNNSMANYNYALALWKQNRDLPDAPAFREANRLLERAIAIDPKFAEAHLLLGILRQTSGELPQAIETYKAAIAVDPNLADAHYRLGLAYRRVGEQSKAQEEFQKYEQMRATQTAAIERSRRELRQFLIVMREQPSVAH